MAYTYPQLTELKTAAKKHVADIAEICESLEDTIIDLTEEIDRLNELFGDVEVAARQALRDGGCCADDLEGLEASCEEIIEIVSKAEHECP